MKKETPPKLTKQSTCPFCDQISTSIFSQTDKKTEYKDIFFVYRCNNCSIDFIEPPKDLAKFYKDDYFSDTVELKNIMYKFKKYVIDTYYTKSDLFSSLLINFISAVPKSKKKEARLLDIGCGPGDIIYLLKNVGFKVYGIDISNHAVEMAHKHGLTDVTQGTELDLSRYEDSFFDYIRGSHVLEHMIEPRGFIELTYNKLKDGGQLLLQLPNISSLGKLFGKDSKYYSDIPRHIILFSTKSLKKILLEAGFTDIHVSYFSLFSDFRDNVVLFLGSRFKNFKDSLPDKLLSSLFFNFIFLPIDLLAGLFGFGQTLTVIAVKPKLK